MFRRFIDDDLYIELLHDRLAAPLFMAVDDSREHLRAWLGWVDHTRAVADSREFIRMSMNAYAEQTAIRCAVIYRGQVCGSVSLESINRANDEAEIGYWLSAAVQGNGIMTRCVDEVTRVAFLELGLHRVYVRVATENPKSFAIPERLGWTLEGTMRAQQPLHGRRLDMRMYSLLAPELPPQRFGAATSSGV